MMRLSGAHDGSRSIDSIENIKHQWYRSGSKCEGFTKEVHSDLLWVNDNEAHASSAH